MLITLDDVRYSEKPDRAEFGKLTNRMKTATPQEVTLEEFAAHVEQGKPFIGGAFDDGLKTLKSWQVVSLDFDDGTLSPIAALERCELLGVSVAFLYFTLSATLDHPRYRLVFVLEEPLHDEERARECIEALLAAFPEADQSCKNPNRSYLGSCGEVWRVWKVYLI